MIKQCKLFIIVVFLSTLFCACASIDISGLDNYQKEICSVGLTRNLYPSDDFLSRFQYENGTFRYVDKDDWQYGDAVAVSHLQYAPDIYKDAKAFALSNFAFCQEHIYEYNGFTYMELSCYPANEQYDGQCSYPNHFNMFAYHDESCTLVFLGYYNFDPEAEEKAFAFTDFGSFLKTAYAEYFDFEA